LGPEKKELETRKLSQRVPLNRDEFLRDIPRDKHVNTRFFRAADILVEDRGNDFRLFASHHYWNSEKRCVSVRVSAIDGSYSNFLGSAGAQTWQTVYESEPCVPFKDKGTPFAGHQIGGKLVLLDKQRLLLATGDHEFDGVYSAKIFSQDETVPYGKTILIDLNSHTASIYSMGHRNPQGLDADRSGTIWLTEHGPKGGDELNVISKGKNYGWPLVTYGTDYTQSVWPLNGDQGRHAGFEPPLYAWTPSIGISAIASVEGSLFKLWKDDLLVSSQKDRSIWRVRVDKGRVAYTERIDIGERIRDLMEDTNGRLILWTEEAIEAPSQTAVVIVEPVVEENVEALEGLTNSERGELLFARCSGCHELGNGETHGIGPDLRGVYRGRVAAAKGYTYSKALKQVSGTWTEGNLDAYLRNPQSFAPGTTMQFEGVSDATERRSLIEYLKTQK
jgi:glucose/arabinose dehydrogenase/cytochrome c2